MILKTIFREIKSSFGRFIAIFAIIALGTGFFGGLRMCKPTIQNAGNEYLAKHNMFDYRLVSTIGYDDEDVMSVSAVDGVKNAVGSISMDILVQSPAYSELTGDNSELVMTALLITEGVNDLQLKAGRMPQSSGECVADAYHMPDYAIGSKIIISNSNDEDKAENFTHKEYTVVGLATSPLYLNYERGTTTLGNGVVTSFLYLTEEGFNCDYFTDIYLTLDSAEGLYIYSDEYKNAVEPYEDILTAAAEAASDRRYNQLKKDAMEELSDGENEYLDGLKEFEDGKAEARQELSDAWEELSNAREDLAQAEIDITEGWVEFNDEVSRAKQELRDAEKTLADAYVELTDGEAEYEKGLAEYNDAINDFKSGEAEYIDGLKKYYDGYSEYGEAMDQWQEYKKELDRAEMSMASGSAQLQEYNAQYQQMQALYNGVSAFATMYGKSSAAELISYFRLLIAEADSGDPGAVFILSGIDANVQSLGVADTRALVAAWDAAEDAVVSLGYGTALNQDALDAMGAALEEGNRQLMSGAIELASAKAELTKAKNELDKAKAELDDAWAQLHDGKMTLYDGETELSNAAAELGNARTELNNGWAEYKGGLQDVEDGWSELNRETDRVTKELTDAEQKLAEGKVEYSDGLAEYLEAKSEVARELADAEKELADARADLDDGWKTYRELEYPTSYCLGRETNIGYSCFKNDSEIIHGISAVFPIFFFAVAALICITTITRMIDEQRTQIGVMKALGYSTGAVAAKYLAYSGIASLFGCVIGFLLGTYGIPKITWNAYKIMYDFGELSFTFDAVLAVSCICAYMICILGITWLCCRSALTQVAAELIRPKAPKAGKRVFLERIPFLWNRLNFLSKVSIRNIFRYKQRLIMMLVGICGCTSLLITGLGLRDSITNVVYFQYDEITKYDCMVSMSENQNNQWLDELCAGTDGAVEEAILISELSMDITVDDVTKTVMMIVPNGDITPFIDLHNNGRHIEYPDPGETVICTSVADHLGLSVGDTFVARDPDLNELTLTVADICENYVYNYIYVSLDTCRGVVDLGDKMDSALINFKEGADHNVAAAKLLDSDGVSSVMVSKDIKERISGMMDSMDYIVVITIVFAAALAFIVLYNLTNISLTERLKEIATIKVLGFYPFQSAVYVFRENLVLTFIGSILGLGFGVWLHRFVMAQVRLESIYFQARLLPGSFVLSVVLTIVFALLVDIFMYPKLKKINMAEALKSIE